MSRQDNPAGRLLDLLERAKTIAKSRQKVGCLEIWTRLFEVEDNEVAKVYAGYVELINLTDTAKKAVENLDNIDRELYLKPFNRIQQGFVSTSFNHTWEQFAQYLDAATMTGLEYCSHTLSIHAGEKIIEIETLKELRKEIDNLRDKVVKATLPDVIRRLFYEKLEEMLRAIDTYQINGAEGMKRAIESAIGGVFLHNQVIDEELKTKNKIVEEVLAFMDKYKGVVAEATVKQATTTAIGTVLGFLTSGQP